MGLSRGYPGWRLPGLVLSILSVIVTIAMVITLGVISRSSDFSGDRVLYHGPCNVSSQVSLGFQLVINVISSIVLASSNFFMQILSAPTRRNVDTAHRKGAFLDIGVPSCRNLFWVPKLNTMLWLILAISSVPIHLLFNSSVLETKASTDAIVLLASESFVSGETSYMAPGIFDLETGLSFGGQDRLETTLSPISQSLQHNSSQWQRIDFNECIKRYNNPKNPLVNYRHMVMTVRDPRRNVTSGWTELKNGSIVNFADSPNSPENTLWTSLYLDRSKPSQSQYSTGDNLTSVLRLDPDTRLLRGRSVTLGGVEGFLQADSCLSEVYTADCKLELHIPFLAIVSAICILKSFVAVTWMVKSRHYRPLLTIGDAIESFIEIPDDNTAGLCTYNRGEFSAMKGQHWKGSASRFAEQRKHDPQRHTLSSVVSGWLWLFYYILTGSLWSVFLYMFFAGSPHTDLNISSFGESVINPAITGSNIGITTAASLANLPQLILSIGYMLYNSIFTCFLAEAEWSSYGSKPKTLRVTEKKGQQRSTYRLQIPYRYSIPLLVLGTVLHWLCSKCIYVAIYTGHSGFTPYETKSNGGFKGLQASPVALVITLVVLPFVTIFPFTMAFVSRSSAMVVGGTCSAVISAACHCITPGERYISPVTTRRDTGTFSKSRDRPSQSTTQTSSQDSSSSEGRTEEGNNERGSLLSACDATQGSPGRQASPDSELNEASRNQDTDGLIRDEEEAKPAIKNFLRGITQGKLMWGVVWKGLPERPPRRINTGPIRYEYWDRVVVVPAPPEPPPSTLAHLSFGTAEQVTKFTGQDYSFA